MIIPLVCAALLIQILMKLLDERRRRAIVPDESVYFKS